MSSMQQQEGAVSEVRLDSAGLQKAAEAHGQRIATANGRVFLVTNILKDLRAERMQSQEEMANACVDGKFRVSIATIKRAESGKAVVYRVARELARYFGVPVRHIVKVLPEPPVPHAPIKPQADSHAQH